ncbi:MAG: hypothetical protein J1D88_09615 [Treponema sp.]|nr:hypothetical protein [Treponema sp.]
MKKVLALVASAMMLVAGGLFVSCSDETKDVHLTNFDDDSISYEYYGTFSGTATSADWSSISVDDTQFGTVEWTTNASNEKSNMKGYELAVPYTYTYTISGTTYRGSSRATIRIGKIGSKYYNSANGDEVKFSSGSPESSSFTIAAISSSGIAFTNLKFTRAK